MSWAPRFKLGPLGGEVEFPCQAKAYTQNEGNVEVEEKNLLGAMLKSFQRVNVPDIAVQFARLPDAYMPFLRGFIASRNPLNFIFNTSLAVKLFAATSKTTTQVTLPPSSATGVAITGVFLASDYAQSGTNYFSGGSTFDPTGGGTGLPLITLATALPAAQTDVTVNYTYAGVACYAKLSVKPHRGAYVGYWEGTLTLTGA